MNKNANEMNAKDVKDANNAKSANKTSAKDAEDESVKGVKDVKDAKSTSETKNGNNVKDGKSGKNLKFARVKYLAAAVLLLFLLLPDALTNTKQVTTRALITTLGIDRAADGQYELTAQIVLPQSSQETPQTQDIVYATGKTVKTAIDIISAKTGKTANLAHCKLLFLGREILEDGLVGNLDFFLRAPEIDNGLMIAATSGQAKGAVEKLSGFDKLSAFSLPDFFSQNDTNDLNSVVTLKNFLEGYYAGADALILPVIDIEEKTDEEKAEGGEADGNPEFPAAQLSADFKTAVIKDGRLAKIISRESTRSFMWLDKTATGGTLLLEGTGGRDAKITLAIKGKTVRIKARFKDGIPLYKIKISLKLSMDSAEGEGSYTNLSYADKKRLAKEITAAAQTKIDSELQLLLTECKDGGFDIMRINEYYFRFKNRKYNAYKQNGGNILQDCRLDVKVNTEVKI